MINLFKINGICALALLFFVLMNANSSAQTTKEISVSGKVVDESNNGIEGVQVTFLDGAVATGGQFKFYDTVKTGSGGAFSKKILVDQSCITLGAVASKDGYYAKLGVTLLLVNNAVFSSLVLEAKGNETNKITVTGQVMDEDTKQPVPASTVVIGLLNSSNNISIDSIQTGPDGKFSIQANYKSTISTAFYSVIKLGYQQKTGSINTPANPLDLGVIYIKLLNVSVLPNQKIILGMQPDNMVIYNMQGQVLYHGPLMTKATLVRVFQNQKQPVVIHYRYKSTVVSSKKFIAF